jgi:hypothetical protein
MDDAGNKLPWLVYVSREKRPGHDHHKKAGALNALVIYSVPSMSFSFCKTTHMKLVTSATSSK